GLAELREEGELDEQDEVLLDHSRPRPSASESPGANRWRRPRSPAPLSRSRVSPCESCRRRWSACAPARRERLRRRRPTLARRRAGRTRVGEAVRRHVSAWRASTGPGFSPRVEVVGPATVERVGDEIIEEQDGRVRERVDFLIEPSAPGLVDLSVLTTAAAS